MDRPIEKKKGIALAFTSKALPYWFGAFMAAFVLWLILRDDTSTLRVNGDTLSISEVTSGEFNDYIRISGQGLVEYIPDEIVIDVTPLQVGQTIFVGDIQRENLTFVTPATTAVCAVRVTRASRAAQ